MVVKEKTADTTAKLILDNAQRLIQTRGYNAFSYADIAAEVGIREASIHYYFPHKSDLGREIVSRYRNFVRQKIAWINAEEDSVGPQLQRFAEIFRDMLRVRFPEDGGRICICAALTTDLMGLPAAIRSEVGCFYAENEAWLARRLDAGRAAGELRFDGAPEVQARAFLAGLQGAMLLARAHGDVEQYCGIAHRLLAQLGLPIVE